MLTVRITAAERMLLRRLAQGHRSDVSEVVSDALLDIIPTLSAPGDAYRLLEALAMPAPCALTVWLPTPLADLLVPGAARIAQITDVRVESASAALGAALRLWLAQDPARLATNLSVMHAGRPAALVAA
ncbi:hypothetical protein ACFU7Y_24455 [Kitasatospora sp. NPDC057542]|uniref:hypothetical protein n=1 Tax=Streptomycetaceae TaxID=2062 RepID=UPI001CCD6714|nr:hypothetical protein [Streptomyces sp. LS1784]